MGNCLDTWNHPSVYSVWAQRRSGTENESSTQGGDGFPFPHIPRKVEDLPSHPLISFTFSEVKRLTGNFSRDRYIGRGGFGRVYKGYISKGLRKGLPSLPVAIKVHDGAKSFQGHREWLTEVTYLGQLTHRNLVRLVGYCSEADQKVLVYEYMSGGSVESRLFEGANPLPWPLRMKIAYDAAKGLAFLHEAKKQVIFRDFKTSNILLDRDYNAKLSDFGLAKDGPVGDNSHVSTRVMGTYGYADPEYIRTGHLSASSDVYSFGVVLLELITGRRSLDQTRPPREQNLTDWALPYLSQRKTLQHIIDPSLGSNYPIDDIYKAAKLVRHCLDENPKARPLMGDIVETLEPLQAPANLLPNAPVPPKMRIESEF